MEPKVNSPAYFSRAVAGVQSSRVNRCEPRLAMFYEQMVLAKKGALGLVWLAAHCEKKLLKSQINDCKIVKTIEQITAPQAPMALRLSGHLLLGVARVYFKKVEYLYTDCSEALVKIKMAFRPGDVNMEQSVVNANSITLPETFPDFELLLPGDLAHDLIPEAEEGLLRFNVAQVKDITIPGSLSDPDPARAGSSPSISLQAAGGEEPPIKQIFNENEILDPDPPQGGYVTTEQGGDWPSGHSEPDPFDPSGVSAGLLPHEIPELPDREPEPGDGSDRMDTDTSLPSFGAPRKPKQAKLKHFAVDNRTYLTVSDMEKYINDPTPLLRKGERAPPTRVLMERKRQELEDDTLSKIFRSPAMKKMPQNARTAFNMSLETRAKLVENFPGAEMEGAGPPRQHNDPSDPGYPVGNWPDDPVYPVGNWPDPDPGSQPQGYRSDPNELPGDQDLPTEPDISSQAASRTRVGTTVGGETTFVVTRNTAKMHKFLEGKFEEQVGGGDKDISFNTLFAGKSKRNVAIGFFEILNLKSKNCIGVHQSKAYADISLTRTANFDKLAVS